MSDKAYIKNISDFLDYKYIGSDCAIDNVCAISNIKEKSISFINKKSYKFDQSIKALVIAIDGYEVEENSKCSFIFSSNPRLDFIKVANNFFINKDKAKIADTVKIGVGCHIADNVNIGEYSVIKNNVIIGENTIIKNHAVIESNTHIGSNCYIKSGAIIGEDGFSFARDENNIPLRFPHIGSVTIKDNVEIGSLSTIAKGTFENTIIQQNTKINDHVHIAHNCVIGENNMIAGCVNISGSVQIGNNCWIGANSSIKDGVIIGNNCFIGIGCIVIKNLDDKIKLAPFGNVNLKSVAKLNRLIK